MPELPEVQTIITDLNKKIKGDMIVGFWTDWPKAIKNKSVKNFTREIKGRKILGARRIGKNIFIDLSGGKTIYIHLKMTGHLLVKNQKSKIKNQKYFREKVNLYIHHVWKLKAQNAKLKTLEFSDLRKFGKILLVDTGKLREIKEIKELGVDIISPGFTQKFFNALLDKKQNKKIRDILMDQRLISGIGNIYASEILYEAGMLPVILAKNINSQERTKLYNSIKEVLEKAIKLRGTSDSDYRDTSGAPGSFQKVLRVYRCEGQPCRKCGTMVKRIRMGQRSAFYCPRCQH
ncbi:MAG: bifunctional DNA-formamidopyrimidine glycosylase/DNA-(apurinic or apyrimidinic site) lyase [Candidatus Moranbacteria bacterium]|nr:bifunctional DNA-formamidopyrimidine glycosylase/DNA-(apurinic or apyrimidinic site) lyase [Candidatus Moranbacteria bacterium]